jgi:hypothetical protein
MSTPAERAAARRARILAGGADRMSLVQGQMKTQDFAEKMTITPPQATQNFHNIDDVDDDMSPKPQIKPQPTQLVDDDDGVVDGHEFVTFSSDDDDNDDDDGNNNDSSGDDDGENDHSDETNSDDQRRDAKSNHNQNDQSSDNDDNDDDDVLEVVTPAARNLVNRRGVPTAGQDFNQSFSAQRPHGVHSQQQFNPFQHPQQQQQHQQQQFNAFSQSRQAPQTPQDLFSLFAQMQRQAGVQSPSGSTQPRVPQPTSAEVIKWQNKVKSVEKFATVCFVIFFAIFLFLFHFPHSSNSLHPSFLSSTYSTLFFSSLFLHIMKTGIIWVFSPKNPSGQVNNASLLMGLAAFFPAIAPFVKHAGFGFSIIELLLQASRTCVHFFLAVLMIAFVLG